MSGPLEVLSSGQLENLIKVPDGAAVLFAAMIPDAMILSRICPANRLCAVGRAVIGYDQLKVGVRLG